MFLVNLVYISYLPLGIDCLNHKNTKIITSGTDKSCVLTLTELATENYMES